MVRRMVCILAAALLLTGTGITARAAEGPGSIRVSLDLGEGTAGKASVILCRVGEDSSEDFRLVESFGGGIIRKEDVHSPELAQWLAERSGKDGTERLLDADGNAVFSNLRSGLYLVTQGEAAEGCCPIAPFLIPLPYEGQWEVQADPKTQRLLTESPRTGDHPAPVLAAMGLILSGMGLCICVEKIRKK